jgi:hypothetical protein
VKNFQIFLIFFLTSSYVPLYTNRSIVTRGDGSKVEPTPQKTHLLGSNKARPKFKQSVKGEEEEYLTSVEEK